MLIEKGNKAYISDKIVDGVVKKATQYIYCNGICTRVGDSVDIIKPYSEIKKHNLIARHTVNAETEEAVNPITVNKSEEVVNVEVTENSDTVVEEMVEPTEKHTFITLKMLNKKEQIEICKGMGLTGHHNICEDDRINMILEAQQN